MDIKQEPIGDQAEIKQRPSGDQTETSFSKKRKLNFVKVFFILYVLDAHMANPVSCRCLNYCIALETPEYTYLSDLTKYNEFKENFTKDSTTRVAYDTTLPNGLTHDTLPAC